MGKIQWRGELEGIGDEWKRDRGNRESMELAFAYRTWREDMRSMEGCEGEKDVGGQGKDARRGKVKKARKKVVGQGRGAEVRGERLGNGRAGDIHENNDERGYCTLRRDFDGILEDGGAVRGSGGFNISGLVW